MKEVIFDPRTKLLIENKYHYDLQDVESPNLFRELFSYEQIPKVSFNHRITPRRMPEHIWITDTTFRDGQQSRAPFTVEQIVHLYKLLAKLGGRNGIVRQSEFFVYSETDRKALHACRDLGLPFPEITTWIRASKKDFALIRELEIEETGILVSCSDYHIFNKLKKTRRQAMEDYLHVVRDAMDMGIRPRCHFEDITRADFYGFVVPFAQALQRLGEQTGIPVKIRCCDTLGLGVCFPGASLPRSVPGIIYGLYHYADVPSEYLEWHGHNDFYRAVSNSANAWLYGCAAVNASLLGIGERTGNCPLEAMAIEYCSLRGGDGGMDLSAITEIAEYFEQEIGYEIPPRTPFVGKDFNVTRAGIHADGLLKDEEIYNIFNTARLLHRPVRVQVDAYSGLAGIAHWIENNMDIPALKNSALVLAVKEKVDALYALGRTTSLSDAELKHMVEETQAELK
ncbi:MAG: 2-isopropylmalate synthase [Clostridiales bacterium]|nr:2-isopropylmalate synthase [Clostridiales bacterium]